MQHLTILLILPIFASRDLTGRRLGDNRAGNLLPQHLEPHVDLAHAHPFPLVGRLAPVLAHGGGLGPWLGPALLRLPLPRLRLHPLLDRARPQRHRLVRQGGGALLRATAHLGLVDLSRYKVHHSALGLK